MGLYIGKMDRKWLSRVLIIMLADILGILGSYLLALWARFDLHFMDIPPEFLQGYLSTIWWWVLICLAVFWLCNLYNSIWRFVSVDALMRIILAYVILGGLSFGCVKLFHIVMPRSYYVWGLLCSFFITAGIRFFYRGVRYLRNRVPGSQKGTENVMIIGAGQAGRQLIREYAVSSHLNSRVACLIDDNPAKRGRILEGVRIVGGRRDIPQAVKRYDIRKIIFVIPSLQGAGRQEILNICSKTGCQIQVVPGIYQLVKGEVTISKLRRVELQDLLGRDPIRVNLGEICGYINDKTVLITGGGGSIGSELCRQIARHKPRRLVIFDIYENNAYDIQMELRREHPELTLDVCIGSVRDRGRVDDLLDTYQPDLIFHAAAHKHVPLMEDSPNEAIKNNVFGTYNMAQSAAAHGVKRFVLISTDKAVNPTNIMGVLQAPVRDGGADDGPAQRHGVRGGAVRQRPGQQRQRGAAVRAADRLRRAGDRDPSGDHPLLHDHPRGGVPGAAGGILCQGRGDFRAGYGPAGEDRRHGPAADPLVRLRAGRGHPHYLHRSAAGGEAV